MLHSVLKSSSCGWWVGGFLGSDSAFLLSFCLVNCACVYVCRAPLTFKAWWFHWRCFNVFIEDDTSFQIWLLWFKMIVLQKLSLEIGLYWNTQILLGVATTDTKITHYSEMCLPPSPRMCVRTHARAHSHTFQLVISPKPADTGKQREIFHRPRFGSQLLCRAGLQRQVAFAGALR